MNATIRRAVGITLAMALGGGTNALAGDIAPALESVLQAGGEIPVIIYFESNLDLDRFEGNGQGKELRREALIRALQAQANSMQGVVRGFLKQRGAMDLVELWLVNGLAATADADTIRQVARFPHVEVVIHDSTHAGPRKKPGNPAPGEWHLDAIKASTAWNQGYSGAGAVVAGMDTGVDAAHPDLETRWRGGSNSWFDPNGEHATPYDADGHGTSTMALMVGGNAGGTPIGVAPDARWIAVKIYDDAGLTTLSGIHQGFQWLLDPDGNPSSDDAPDVVNNSWGFDSLVGDCYPEFEPDIAILKTVGIAVVFSAGNQGPGSGSSVSPGNNTPSFAAGAVDENLLVADFSSRGPGACDGGVFPEVVAPGVNVRTADLTAGGVIPDSYAYVSGTSFAAPLAAGSLALLYGAYPDEPVATLEQSLQESAVDIDLAGPDDNAGYGLLDVAGALSWLASRPPDYCTDSDADGYFAEAGCGTLADCNDAEADINPAACDVKGDGIDQDCDGADRLNGKSCPIPSDGGGGDTGGTAAEGKGGTCSDTVDNDGDGLTDCDDADCSGNRSCRIR